MAKGKGKQGRKQSLEDDMCLTQNKYKKLQVEKGIFSNKYVSQSLEQVKIMDGKLVIGKGDQQSLNQPMGRMKQKRFSKYDSIKKGMRNFIDKKQKVLRDLNDEEKQDYLVFSEKKKQNGAKQNQERIT